MEKIAFLCDANGDDKAQIVKQFEGSLIRTEKLKSPDHYSRFAFRLNKKSRVVCTTAKHEGDDCLVILNIDHTHKYETNSALKKGMAEGALSKFSSKYLKKTSQDNMISGLDIKGAACR